MGATYHPNNAESSLMAAVARGDQLAFERLYTLYERRVFQYVCTHVFDCALAEEIVGDTMMAVWRGAAKFSGTSRVSTWIFGIARHKALDAVRRTVRHQQEGDLDGARDLPDPRAQPAEGIYRDQVCSLMARAMSTMTPEHQEILRLVFYEELPYDEIAALLSIPTNTVKTRVFYAKRRLKELLARLDEKEPIR